MNTYNSGDQESSKISFPKRVDEERFLFALDAADYLLSHHNSEGDYFTDESWGPEGEIYRAVCVWVLLDVYNLTGSKRYVSVARTILNRFKSRQCISGGWAISLGRDGLRFKITESERKDSNKQEDPVIAGAVLKSIADYSISTGSEEFDEMGASAFQYITDIWDDSRGTIIEDHERELTSLRSNSDAYHFLVLQGISAWAERGSDEAKNKFSEILQFVGKTFESFDNETMPLMIGYHVAILAKYNDLAYCIDVIAPKLDEYLSSGLFLSNTILGGYGHRDGLRGIVTDELHMRSAIGVAYAMKAFDHFTNTNKYTSSGCYQDVSRWIFSMKSSDGGFYEFQDSKDGVMYGKGSPAQYLVILWILGSTLK